MEESSTAKLADGSVTSAKIVDANCNKREDRRQCNLKCKNG